MSEPRTWLGVPVAGLVAAVGSIVSDADLNPPGPLFLIFAFGACSAIPSEPRDLAVAGAVAGCSAACAVLVGTTGVAYRNLRHPHRSVRTPFGLGSYAAVARRHALRYVVSVVIADTLATGIGVGHPYWAMVGAVFPWRCAT